MLTRLKKLQLLKDPAAAAALAQLEAAERVLHLIETQKGEPGETPVKYVDYFTPAEVDQIVRHIQAQIRTPQDGRPGRDGAPGKDGADGRDGAPGSDGTPGKDGESPKLEDVVAAVLAELPNRKLSYESIDGMPDIKDLHGLIAFLKRGGFRGGGTAGTTTTVNSTYNEVVAGSGTTFTLARTPTPGTVRVYGLGQRLLPNTYSITGAVITTSDTWTTGQITADYNY